MRAVVAGYSGYRAAGQAPARHRGLPSPYLTLIFTLDDPLVVAGHPDPHQAPAAYDTLAGGLHTAPALIDHDGWQSGVQLAVTPLAARALFGMPAGELASLDVEGTDVLGPLAREIQERLRAASTWPERFAALDRLLLARIDADRPGPRPEVVRAWHRLLAVGGQARVPELAAETGWSERHLRSQFRAEIGLTPKAAGRVIRFDRARRLAQERSRAGGRWSLADLAADCGYYDQAHLDREFRALAGCAPTRWLAEEACLIMKVCADGQASGPGPVPKRPSPPSAAADRLGLMTDNGKTPPPQVWPTLRARDARGLIRFLVDAFGFEETVVYADGDMVHHAQLSWPLGGGVMLGSVREEGGDGWPVPPGSFGAYVVTDDPDALFARATAAGAEIISGLHETDYGSRDFAARDPEGNRWSFGTYRGEPRGVA